MFTYSNHSNSFSLSCFTIVTTFISLYLFGTFFTTAMSFMFQACVLWNLLCFKLLLWVVLYLRLSGQFYVFFLWKKFEWKKASKCKINDFHPFISFYARKIVAFVVFCLLNFVLLVVFYLICIFVLQKSFHKKK